MARTHLYLIAYDIACPRRWRSTVRQLEKIGERVQLSVFAARMSPARAGRLEKRLRTLLDPSADRLFFADLGAGDGPASRISGAEIGEIRSLIL
jgi:CRISPR-associated protein Cas2